MTQVLQPAFRRAGVLISPHAFRPKYQLRFTAAVLLCLLACVGATAASALDLGKGPVPLEFEVPRGTVLDPGHEIVLEGTVSGSGTASVVLRVDDALSIDWNSRFNREQTLGPGFFRVRAALKDLKTRAGRELDLASIRRVVFARFEGNAAVTVTRASIDGPLPSSFKKPVELPTGAVNIVYEPRPPVVFSPEDTLLIEGVVEGGTAAGFLVRIDDTQSSSYPTRVNYERTLPPGPFRFRLAPVGLKTSSGRPLDHQAVVRIVLARYEGSTPIRITRFSVVAAERLPEGAKAYALAAPDAPVLPGLERIAPGDLRVIGTGIHPISRGAPDPAVASGLRGVDFVRLPWPEGRARVSIFTEDPGEWELLPFPLRRAITVNGAVALSRNWSPEQWISQRYLRLAEVEHGPSEDAWTAYGRHRGEVVSVEVDTTNTGIVIELTGDRPEGKHLTAIVVEPAGRTSGLEFVQAQRAEWYRSNFPKADVPDPYSQPAMPIDLGTDVPAPVLRATSAAGTGAWISIAVTAPTKVDAPQIRLEAPSLGGKALLLRAWAGQRRLERVDTRVALRDNRLVSNLSLLPLSADTPRSYELWVAIAGDAGAGLYRGAIEFSLPGASKRIPIEIEVLGAKLPPLTKPAGFYHFAPPHYAWFATLAARARRQTECDLQTLAWFGAAAGTAPSGAMVKLGQLGGFLEDMKVAQRSGVAPGWLLYGVDTDADATLEDRAKAVGAAGALMLTSGLGMPVWSAADEPSNADQHGGNVREWVDALRRHAPLVKLGAQLNSKNDSALASLFDVAILNPGFGLDKRIIDDLATQGRTVWLYNAEYMRLAAGLWLWQTRAQRYVQWHARSPLADPFDPLDGREADFQILYPTVAPCPALPDVHRDLLRLANGIVDQRWLGWLDGQKGRDGEGIKSEILRRVGGSWSDARKLSPQALDQIRQLITDQARRADGAAVKP